MLASIPSPSSGSIEIGPVTLRAYGLMIALGVLAAVWLFGKRMVERGIDGDHAAGIAMWAVPAGLIGARLYHVITDWRSFEGRWEDAFKIWEGGLGIPGGIALGTAVGIWQAHQRGITTPSLLELSAPALPLAQAIGRWGNWFNQELYGKPSDLPWALEIDAEHRVAGYTEQATFHPTFLYESLWNFALVAFLLWIDRRRVLRPGALFAVYIAGYATGRIWIETIRIDTASRLFDVRINIWVMSVVLLGAVGYLAWRGRRPADQPPEPAGGRESATGAESVADDSD
jgi:prolipoprotein diacylglyceryl transferase